MTIQCTQLLDINDVSTEPANLRAPGTQFMAASAGRRAALQCLDSMLLEEPNIQRLREDLQVAFDASPLGFFKQFVMPLLPKETPLQNQNDESMRPLQIVLIDATTNTANTTKNAPNYVSVPDNTGVPESETGGEKINASPNPESRPEHFLALQSHTSDFRSSVLLTQPQPVPVRIQTGEEDNNVSTNNKYKYKCRSTSPLAG